jgi:hypothetical protein
MSQGRICVGAHNLADFESLRLFRADGTRFHENAEVEVGEVWELEYLPRAEATAPHLEDVLVDPDGDFIREEPNVADIIRRRDVVWASVDELFDGCLAFTGAGTAYVPDGGPFPTRSTGYWEPDEDLSRYKSFHKWRYLWHGGGSLGSLGYVGVAEPVPVIRAGSLVRLSLSQVYEPAGKPRGYWLQLSGWFV